MRYGGRLLTPNAHRALLEAKREAIVAGQYAMKALAKLRDAALWQYVEWPLPDKREPWSELKKKMRP